MPPFCMFVLLRRSLVPERLDDFYSHSGFIMWRIDSLLSDDPANSSRCLITAGKRINNTRAIASHMFGKWVPAATVEVLLNMTTETAFFVICAHML
jgi:hypothetical protein